LAEVAFVLSQCTRLADRQTNGQTEDRQMLIAILRLHSCSAGKIDCDYTQNRPKS